MHATALTSDAANMSKTLAIYLHDHLGAANFALELLAKWSRDEQLPGLAPWAQQLHAEVDRDRDVLCKVITLTGRQPHSLKEVAGWLAEKISRYKFSRRQSPEFAHFEGLEILALGILGKVSLWQTLNLLTPDNPGLAAFAYPELIRRAEKQHDDVESRRLSFARPALSGLSGGLEEVAATDVEGENDVSSSAREIRRTSRR